MPRYQTSVEETWQPDARVAELNAIHDQYMRLLNTAGPRLDHLLSQSNQELADYAQWFFYQRGLLSLYPVDGESFENYREFKRAQEAIHTQMVAIYSSADSIQEDRNQASRYFMYVQQRKNFVLSHLSKINSGEVILPFELIPIKYEDCPSFLSDFRFTLIGMEAVLNPSSPHEFAHRDINSWLKREGINIKDPKVNAFLKDLPTIRCSQRDLTFARMTFWRSIPENVRYDEQEHQFVIFHNPEAEEGYPRESQYVELIKQIVGVGQQD